MYKSRHCEPVTDVTTVYRELLRKQVSKKFYYGVAIRIPRPQKRERIATPALLICDEMCVHLFSVTCHLI